MPDKDISKTVLKAYRILDIISKEYQIGISELARKSQMKKSTVARLVNTLKQTGLVEQDRLSQKFSITTKIFEFSSRLLLNLDVRLRSKPLIADFVQQENKSVLLAIISMCDVVYIDKFEAEEFFHIRTPVGGRAPIHCSASGKAMLSFLEPEQRRQILNTRPLKAYTPRTLTNLDDLEQDLAATRERGYCIEFEEFHPGLSAVAAPIFDRDNRVIASITLPRISASINEAELNSLGSKLVILGRNVSRRMGWNLRHSNR